MSGAGLRFRPLERDRDSGARCGLLETPHGPVATPAFVPVGTYGAVKGLRAQDLEELGVEMVLANLYHLLERPGLGAIAAVGGLHRFMGWRRPLLTDSGGYQVFSLAGRCSVDDHGVTFRSPLDGALRRLTPESVVLDQARLGTDVAMVLDECVANPSDRATAERAVRRTERWARRSRPLAAELPGGLFAIVQGGIYPDLRRAHAEELAALGFDGYAIGGLAVGETRELTWAMVEATVEGLPADRPRYLMGMGTPAELVEAVARGVDLFDCVLPTRNARNGLAFTSQGALAIRNRRFAEDPQPLDPACPCPTCSRYSRAYIRSLRLRGEMLAAILLTWHNLHHYLDTMRRIRQAIAVGAFAELRAAVAEAAGP